jgi:hypothetical protein
MHTGAPATTAAITNSKVVAVPATDGDNAPPANDDAPLASAAPTDVTGTIAKVKGGALIHRGGSTIAAQPGTPIMVHDKVTTLPGSSVTLGFDDGSLIALSSEATVEIESNTTDGQTRPSHVTLISGNIHSIIPDKPTGEHGLEVNTTNATVTGASPNE